MKEGLFIVIYGIKNLGKTTQARKLVDSFNIAGLDAEYLEYPIELGKTGERLKEIMASGLDIDQLEVQRLSSTNRLDFQAQLCKKLIEGISIVAEGYIGQSLVEGLSKGLDFDEMMEMNKGLLRPDVSILLDGESFSADADRETANAREAESLSYLNLAEKFSWSIIDANQGIEEVADDILKVIEVTIKEIAING